MRYLILLLYSIFLFKITVPGFFQISKVTSDHLQQNPPQKNQQNRILIKEGETVVNTEEGYWSGYDMPREVKVSLVFRNNTIISSNSSGYMLKAGDENPEIYNNNLDGELITGNRLIWNGNDANSITHGVFTGYNINVTIKYNYLERTPMGLIRKSNGMSDTSGGIAYNIVNDPTKVAVAIKGINNVKIFNNTFYSSRSRSETWRPLIHIYANDNPVASSTGIKIFNNIFYTKHQIFNITVENSCLKGFECDYNLYWCEDGEAKFMVGNKELSFREWQKMGYDLHSRILDPKFNNTTEFVPESRLDYGKDLGSEWEKGLSTDAIWGKTDPGVAIQNGPWQVGARIYEAARGKTFYISVTGNDNNPGTIDRPFATWQKGFQVAAPGDTVYIRGGRYTPATGNIFKVFGSDFHCGVCVNNKKGSRGKTYNIMAFPGEKPILDCSNFSVPAYRAGILLYECDYWHIKGLEVTKAGQVQGYGAFGIYLNNCNNNLLEQVVSHNHGGSGIRIGYASENNLLLNCDAFDCYDPLSMSGDQPYYGGHADGIEVSDIFERNGNERLNTLIGCRVWNNSDDGYDFYQCEGIIVMDHCWAWKNGYDYGDGSGFKLGTTKGIPEKRPQRILSYCLSFSNSKIGFDQNTANVLMKLYNCVAYNNGTYGFNFQWHNIKDTLINNISYKNGKNDILLSNQFRENNSWDSRIKLTDADFVSLVPDGVDGPRQPDGKLPEIKFLHLKSNSDLIHAGRKSIKASEYYNMESLSSDDIGAFPSSIDKDEKGRQNAFIKVLIMFWPFYL